MYRRRRNQEDGMMGCLAIVIIGIIAMPLVGAYLTFSKNSTEEKKGLGIVLMILGIIFWIYIGIH